MVIPPFSLPSCPSKKITLREATVSDAMDFADVTPSMEEHLTTMFLNRMQTGDKPDDSLKWTMQDRRLALYWYWMHTAEDTVIETSYDCPSCQSRHRVGIDMKKLADKYKELAGKPEREFPFTFDKYPEQVTVRNLSGADAERLEDMRLHLVGKSPDGPEYRKLKTQLRMMSLVLSVRFSSAKFEDDTVQFNEKKILGMTVSQLEKFTVLVAGKLADMEHGLPCDIDDDGRISLTHMVACDADPEVKTLLRVPFWDIVHIPTV